MNTCGICAWHKAILGDTVVYETDKFMFDED